MEHYIVTGMSCAACQARVEKAVKELEGVENCSVSLLTNSMVVEGSVDPKDIIEAVKKAGYGASKAESRAEEASISDESRGMKNRLIGSLFLLLPLMYVSMGHMMWNWPVPGFMKGNVLWIGVYELVLSGLVLIINRKFFVNGVKGIINKSPNMDTLVSLGASASYGYSVYVLIDIVTDKVNGISCDMMAGMEQFYFESAAMIVTLITVGKLLEAKSKGKTTNALKSLMKLAPKTAVKLVDGAEQTVPIEDIYVGDSFVVRPGDSIPVDGIVIEGHSAVNEAALTGESVPVEKKAGDLVSAATINTSGFMVCRAQRVGEDTTLASIIRMVSDAAATKAPIAKLADRVSGVFVPAVMIISLITFLTWLMLGQGVGYAVKCAVAVLVISCPCALGLATPVAIMVGNGVAAKAGILFKTAASLELTGKAKIVALDKTGTITTGEMKVTELLWPEKEESSEKELLSIAYSLEIKSEHPISKAIIKYARENGVSEVVTTNFEAVAGNGLRATYEGEVIAGGNLDFVSKLVGNETVESTFVGKRKLSDQLDALAKEGKTPVIFVKGREILGVIAVSDTIKEDSEQAIDELKNMGLHVVMVTGDNRITAQAIAEKAGVDEVVSEVSPAGKENVIKKLMSYGEVIMVGDGINDAPSLTRADIGIAIGAGTDVAIDAGDIVLMRNSIKDVAAAIRISRATIRNIIENLFWAFIYNMIGIPLAAGCFVKITGWTLNPMFGAAAMGLSSFCVVSNALRLNRVKAYDSGKERVVKNPISGCIIENDVMIEEKSLNPGKEIENMEKKITVNGMMCAHCEAHVKRALEAIEGIEEAKASHEENSVIIKTSGDVDEALIKAAIEDAGYEYVK